jgi:hypothetical protein
MAMDLVLQAQAQALADEAHQELRPMGRQK